jgi:predicted amidohydrolase
MKVALVQMDVAWHKPGENLEKARALVAEAASRGANVAVLPEMFVTGFTMDTEVAAEAPGGPSSLALKDIAREEGINLIAGLALMGKVSEGPFNSALVIKRNGEISAEYRKCQPFSPVGEDFRYQAGPGPMVFDLEGSPSSVFICYDLRFPELMRSVAAQVLMMFFIANWPAARARHWNTLLTARAIENQCFVIGANRTGTDGNSIHYDGGSLIVGPTGLVLQRAGASEGIYMAEFNPEEASSAREEFPALKDRRFK